MPRWRARSSGRNRALSPDSAVRNLDGAITDYDEAMKIGPYQ